MQNEVRLIDANALNTGIADYLVSNAYLNDTAMDALKMVGEWVQDAPTIDAVPVVNGRWEYTKKHLWYKDEDGKVDTWYLDCGYHNGPGCEICGESFCEHCDPDWAEYECEIGHYVCSICGQPTKTGGLNYCPNCGAKMDGGAEG